MTETDILSPAQVKRWLLSCYRPIRWDSLEEVGEAFSEAFREADLVLANMDFREMEGTIEFRFIANRLTEETYAHVERITRRYGGQLADIRCTVEHQVRSLGFGHEAFQFRGPSKASVTAVVRPPGSQPRGLFGEAMAAGAARFARVFGQRHRPVVIDYRNQGGIDPDGDY